MAVQGIDRVDQEFDESSHLVVILDHQVDVTVSRLNRDAMPAVKWQFFLLVPRN